MPWWYRYLPFTGPPGVFLPVPGTGFTVPVFMDFICLPVPSPPLEQASPLSHKRLGTRSAAHVLLSEVDESPWLLPRREDRPMKKSVAIRAAISAINTYGILVVPGLVEQRTAAGCAADADAALGESLLSCDGSSPCRYAVQLGLTRATRAAVLAVRGSAPMASALAAQLGDDAALCELSCETSDGGAPIKPMHCATPTCVEDAQTPYQEALAQRGASVLTVLIALCDVAYRAGAPLVWPRSHAAAVHADVRTRGADALREVVGVHFDLRCGDAVLLDSRLWRCGGAHAPGLRRTALLAISFCMPSLFPDGIQYAMRATLVAQFSLLNMEAALARFIDWEASCAASIPAEGGGTNSDMGRDRPAARRAAKAPPACALGTPPPGARGAHRGPHAALSKPDRCIGGAHSSLECSPCGGRCPFGEHCVLEGRRRCRLRGGGRHRGA